MHEFTVLDAFDGEEVCDLDEDVIEIGGFGFDVEGGGHGELAVACCVEAFEGFNDAGVERAVAEEGLVGTEVVVHLGAKLWVRFEFESSVLGNDG